MQMTQQTLAGLECRILDAAEPELAVILCHGFGAPGTDLVPLGPEILTLADALDGRVQFVFPAAPLQLDEHGLPGGRAWWMLDIEQLNRAIALGEFRDLRNDRPDGLIRSRESLHALATLVRERTGLPWSRIVLGGFSQGAMVATDLMLHLDAPVALLSVLSGTLLNEPEWRQLAADHAPVPVLQSHGRQDPILPYAASEWLRDLLIENGFEVEFLPFDGVHTIPYPALQRLAQRLQELLET